MKAVIHVNQHIIRANSKGDPQPPLTIKTYKSNERAWEVEISGPSKVIYRPDNPLACGAKVWIEADYASLRLR